MSEELLTLTADIVSSHLSNNSVAVADVPALIQSVYEALNKAGQPAQAETPKAEPAVSIRTSVKPDYIVCLEDGKKLKMLKRYLRTNYDMSPEDYRSKWGLPRDYPMVAPNYAEQRRGLAQKIGLGRRPGTAVKTATKAVKAASDALESARKRVTPTAKSKTAAGPKAPAKPRGRPAKKSEAAPVVENA